MSHFDFSGVAAEVASLSKADNSNKTEDDLAVLNDKRCELDYYHREALLVLEKKFHELCSPLYDRRSDVISANPDSLKKFWLVALKNHPLISNLISESDEELLSKISDIKLTYLENATGFKLDFTFSDNDFISDRIISKTYYLENVKEANYQNLLFDRTESSEINWKSGKNLCSREVTKTQRHRASGVMRTITKNVKTESFFHFFDPMSNPSENEDIDDEKLASIEEEIQFDLEIGNAFKLSLVPRAYDWYTGRALSYEYESENDECLEYDLDDESMESGEDIGSDEDFEGESKNESNKDNPQCKQQ